jgi:hypothetical protein
VSQKEPLHRLAVLYFVDKIHCSISFFCVWAKAECVAPHAFFFSADVYL